MTNHVHLIAIPCHKRSLSLTLGQTHSPYSLQVNRQRHWVGYLWQNRFYSCPLDPAHLLCALQYVDLNPVRAGSVKNAREWTWSSARDHTQSDFGDQLLPAARAESMEHALSGEWNYADRQAQMAGGQSEEKLGLIRRAANLGEPLGSDEFISALEKAAGRRLRVWEQGRPLGNHVSVLAGQIDF